MDAVGTAVYEMIDRIIDFAMDEHPWDAGYRIDFYRRVAADLNELADGLEEEADGLGYIDEEA